MGKKNLSDAVRNNLAQYLLTFYHHGILKHGVKKRAGEMFGMSPKAVYTIWENAKEQMDMGLPIHLTNNKSGQIRAKYKVFDPVFFMTIALRRRTTLRRAAKALSVSPSTVWRWKHSKMLRGHTSAIRVRFTPDHKLKRLVFCLKAIKVDTTLNKWIFKGMFHIVHIDEKWFYLTKTAQKYYLSPFEPDPQRDCVNKQFICKIMFLCAVTRPIVNPLDNSIVFDGKIGIYPFTKKVAAIRTSINRPAGTLVTKAVDKVDRELVRDTLVNQVVPDIKAQWPLEYGGHILIQQDNAPAHVTDDDPAFAAVARADGFDIHLVNQPAKSPDLNINDLGWFRALQSIQDESAPLNVDELVSAVVGSFEELDPMKLNYVFLTLQSCMTEILRQRGHNNYKLPHMAKQTLLREGRLPIYLEVDPTLVRKCVSYCQDAGLGEEVMSVIEEMEKLAINLNNCLHYNQYFG